MRGLVFLVAVALVAAACTTNAHDPLIDELDALALPASVSFFVDVTYGSATGFMGSDPLVVRYYLSDLSPEELCEALTDIKASLDLTDRPTGGTACVFGRPSTADDRPLQMTVTSPREVVPAGDTTIYPTPIDIPHGSVLVVSIG